ncbi:MAG: hotdog family protein [Syntrophales bacterium]
MENLSRPVETVTIPVAIPVPAYLGDHHVSGRVVLPAVEALQALARTLPAAAGAVPRRQEGAVFSHLLAVEPGVREIAAIHELTSAADGRYRSRLMTVVTGRNGAWTRRIEHVSVFFSTNSSGDGAGDVKALRSCFDRTVPTGPVFTVSHGRLYDELVPFGPAYRNVAGDLRLAPAGATAELSGGDYPEAAGPLGSPFPFDAALHVACAWGQRYRGIVAFPVGFDRREIAVPTRAGETYRCRVVPMPDAGAALVFDILIADGADRPVEVIRGVAMRDISGGRRKPPAWVGEGV